MPRKKIEFSYEQLIEAISYCLSWEEVAGYLNCGTDTLRRERKKFGLTGSVDEIKRAITNEIPEDYLDDILPVTDKDPVELNHVKIEVEEGTKEVLIIPFGDVHWGHEKCDKRTLRIVLDWLYKTKNAFVIGIGDLVESSIIGSPGLFDQEKFLDEQVYDVVKMLKPLAEDGRILGLHVGNHERRTIKGTSFNITKLMCEMLKVKYLGEGMTHLIEVTDGKNTQKYTMYTTHGASGARYPHTKMKACINLEQIVEVECYCMGHVHSLGHQKLDRYVPDIYTGTIEKLPRHYVLTGAYLKYWGSYAQTKAYPPSGDSGSPKVKFHIDNHRISVSL